MAAVAVAHEVLAELSIGKHDITEVQGSCSAQDSQHTYRVSVICSACAMKVMQGEGTKCHSMRQQVAHTAMITKLSLHMLTVGHVALEEARRWGLAVSPEEGGHVSV